MVEITASYPAGIIGTTMENLKAAAAGENEEWTTDYPHFADVADQKVFLLSPLCIAESLKLKRGMRKDIWLY